MSRGSKLVNDDKLMLPEYFVAGQPHAEWKILREQCPVYWSEPTGYRPYWSVTKHKHIIEVESQPDVFLNAPRWIITSASFDEYMEKNFGHMNNLFQLLVQMDGPQHTKHRMLMQPWFSPKELAKRQEPVTAICRSLFDKLRAKGREGEIDFAQDFVFRYPLRIACAMLGVPEEDDEYLLGLAGEVLQFRTPEPGAKSGIEKALDYCNNLAEEKRAHPADDFATFLALAKIDDKPLEARELLAHYLTVVTAGHDTTASVIANGIKTLVENPDQLQAVREDPSLIPSAVEEMIRWTSPTVQFVRTAARDYVLDGQTIKKGEALVLLFSSANRDEEVFENPDKFDIRRSPNNHLAFGSGPHSCMGSQLGRMQARIFLKLFLEHIEHMEVIGPTPWFAGNLVTRIEHLPVRYRFSQ